MMDCFRIRYQRGSDILDMKFEGNRWAGFELEPNGRFQYGLRSVSRGLGDRVSVAYVIIFFTENRAAVIKSLLENERIPIENFEAYIDFVLQSHPNRSISCFDFYKLRDGSWKEIDKTYDKNNDNEFKKCRAEYK